MHALVIDDSRTMRRIVGSVLRKCGLDPVEAEHGEEALAQLDRLAAAGTPPVLATVDWNMPVMDGLTFVTRVRDSGAWTDLTLVMVTTESEHGQIVRALAAGAHEYVIKPFTTEDMVSKLSLLGLVRADAEAGLEVRA
ncbi:MAG: response regulator [Kineosporiaceae bacterium]